ncbi:hypothetical protein GCM10022280_17950 [Sphingomonas swuensis]|uniref:Uncharacterized protein n=1 Tax=Sphingomonas swuensis TaxID=977800 RepID=A0ABP7SZP4_9SPHN
MRDENGVSLDSDCFSKDCRKIRHNLPLCTLKRQYLEEAQLLIKKRGLEHFHLSTVKHRFEELLASVKTNQLHVGPINREFLHLNIPPGLQCGDSATDGMSK